MEAPPYNALAQFNEPMQTNALARGTLKPGPEPTGYDRLFDGIYGALGGTPDRRALAEALSGAVNVGTLGMATGAYDGAEELGQTGRPGSLAMALMPGAKVAGAGAQAATQAAKKGIRAFHGSPHDFDRFDLSKIGTGEGAQAYGHGLYFAENEAVARDYRNKLSGKPAPASQADADSYRSAVLAKLQGKGGPVPDIEMKQPGRMYEVNIKADPEDFLDWDKPLSQQSDSVRERVNALGIKQRDLDYQLSKDQRGGFAVIKALQNHTGKGTEGASQALKEAGFPGIRYLDQGSRGAGEGSRNYVAFDDSLIEILRKYGLLPPAVAGGVAASQSDAQAGQ